MLDFNSKKEILRRLRIKGQKNILMYVPCAIAAFFVKLWYAIACRADMALSDKEGNLLGIKGLGKRDKTPKKDDVIYIRKSFFGRFVSAALAFSMLLMLVPAVDLGLSIPVKAVDVTPNIRAKDKNGNEMFFTRVGGTTDKVYLDEDYEFATNCKVNIISYNVAYGAFTITWKAVDPDGLDISRDNLNKIWGYRIRSTVGNIDRRVTRSTGDTQTETFTLTNYNYIDEINVEIAPIVSIDEWNFTPAQPGSTGVDYATVEKIGKREFESEVAPPCTVGIADATLQTPDLTIEPVDSYDTYAHMTWNNVNQEGGNDSDPATGYRIYRRNVTAGESFQFLRESVSPHDDGLIEGSPLLPGNHYQYFIEAYKINWGPTTYNENNPGMVTSGHTNVPASKIKDIYIAPAKPRMTVTPNTNTNIIEVAGDPVRGTYTGVYLFRSEGAEKFDESDVIGGLGGKKFGEWMVDNCLDDNPYGVEFLAVLDGENVKYQDSNIIEGKTYWYYAVSYIDKDRGGSLYSEGVEAKSSVLSLNLDSPLAIIFTKGDGQTTLSWDPVDGADGYQLEITKITCHDPSHKGEKACDKIDVVETKNVGNVTTYLHNYLYNNDVYRYRLRAYKNVRSTTDEGATIEIYPSAWTSYVTITVGNPISPPLNVSATTVDGAVTVKWDPVQDADTYTLFWENLTSPRTGSGSFKGLTGLTYTQTNLINDDRYTYYVRAYKYIDGDGSHGTQEIQSDPSNSVTLKVGEGLGIPQDLEATTKDGQITVSWSDVDGAEGYILQYRRQGEQWADFKDHNDLHNIDLTPTEFNHTRLNNGDIYEYRVIAYKTVSGERVYSEPSIVISMTVGDILDTPKDFNVTTTDGTANLTWTASPGAEGYIVYANSSAASYPYQFDLSKPGYTHSGLINGDTWTYYVVAYKTVNGERTYSNPTKSISVQIGISMTAAVDLTATPGNRQILLEWSEVTGAEGYAVYLYNDFTMEYEAITVTSETEYLHRGLTNGKNYRYMVAAYKTVGGKRVYGEYSMPVDAIPMAGSLDDIDRELTIKGTAPYGISHGEYISAAANHGAFDQSVDVYFTTSDVSTQTIREILNGYADGIGSFIVYPFDISIYQENTRIEMEPNNGYSVTITMPIPDRLIAYRDYITVIHINEDAGTEEIEDDEWYNTTDRRMEVLPAAVLDIDNVWCIQFEVSSFSPFAIVIYKDHISDVSSGGGVADGMFAGNFNSGLLLFTGLPDILLNNNKLRVVSGGRKKYRVKSIDKIVK